MEQPVFFQSVSTLHLILNMIGSISLENIRKEYTSSKFSLHIDYLKFSSNNIHIIVGPNGSGKSTLLKLVALMDRPQEGRIIFDERDILRTNNEWQKLRRKIGFLTQNPYLFNTDVSGNIALGLKIRGYSKTKIVSKVTRILKMLKISHLACRNIKQLSGGERQKVALAQILVLEPEVLLLDEPTAGIDIGSISTIENTIKNIQKNLHPIIIMTTHSLNQAYRISPHITSIADGKIIDFLHENVFFGQLQERSGGLKCMEVAEKVEIMLVTERSGDACIAIDPESIILSVRIPKTSARNCFRGEITKIESVGPNVRLLIDTGVPIYSVITKQSFEELGINIGSSVFVSFKVNSVKVI